MLYKPDRMERFAHLFFGRFRLVLVFVIFLIAGWLGRWHGFVAAIAAHLIFTAIASQFLIEVYDLPDRWQAFIAFLSYVFALGYPVLAIREGEIISKHTDSPVATIGGPGIVVIDSCSAAAVVGHEQARVLGPGTHMLRQGHRLQGAVDLRQQRGTYQLTEVFTKDGIQLTITFSVLYRIVQGEGILVRQARYEPSTPAVIRAILATHDWKAQTELLSKATVRDTIAQFDLDSLLGIVDTGEIPSDRLRALRRANGVLSEQVPRISLQEEIRSKLSAEAGQWGVEALKVTLDEVQMPDPARGRLLEAWGAHWKGVIQSSEAEVEAHAQITRAEGKRTAAKIEAEAIETKAEAEARAIQLTGQAVAQAQAELYRQTLAALQPLGRVLDDEYLLYLARALILKDVESLEKKFKARSGLAAKASGE
jgi:regulator of protease activity HflC (stomatin/prohibitin superfamily)